MVILVENYQIDVYNHYEKFNSRKKVSNGPNSIVSSKSTFLAIIIDI